MLATGNTLAQNHRICLELAKQFQKKISQYYKWPPHMTGLTQYPFDNPQRLSSGVFCFMMADEVIKMMWNKKAKLPHNKSWRHRRGKECWASIFILTFGTTWTTELSALNASQTLHRKQFLRTHFCYRMTAPQDYWMRAEGMGHLKVSSDPTGNGIKMMCFSKMFTTYRTHRCLSASTQTTCPNHQ